MRSQFGSHLILIHKQGGAFRGEIEKRRHHGIAMDVAGTDVQNPRDFSEIRHKQSIGSLRTCFGEHPLDLGSGILAGILHIVDKSLIFRHSGAIGPDLVNRIEINPQFNTVTCKRRSHTSRRIAAEEHTVDTNRGTSRKNRAEIIDNGRRFGFTVIHHANACAIKLESGLNPITRVSPDIGLGLCHHQIAGRAGKARQPTAHLPMGGDIFTLIRIGLGNNHGIDPGLTHRVAQLPYPGLNIFFHNTLRFVLYDIGGDTGMSPPQK